LKFDFGYLEHIMEGKFRPGHFNGVATVVSKFFNFVSPDKAYFGQKDIQQVAVIKAMVVALSFQVELVVVPTLREESGLAMSSRNQRLTSAQFDQASVIYKALTRLKNQLLEGGDFNSLQQKESCELEQKGGFKVEYLELVDASTLENVVVVESGEYAICIAAYLGDVRLIDNLVFIAE
jgi:pantoate--beta-alanine ligase